MTPSPRKVDALRDSEARVRALTREVGTLREELRRETKRRERAIAQVGTMKMQTNSILNNVHLLATTIAIYHHSEPAVSCSHACCPCKIMQYVRHVSSTERLSSVLTNGMEIVI